MAKDRLADWDTTAGNNTDVGGISIDEGWPPENVNNASREKMAQVAAFFKDKTGTITSTNVANAYSITTNDGVTAYAAGQLYAFIANAANTGAATLNVNTIGAKSIVKNHDIALESGDIEANQICLVAYGATDDTFQLLSMPAQVITEGANVDIANTTAETDIDKAADSILVYDDSASANREAVLSDIIQTEQATAQSTAAGTEFDFTIESWVKEIIVLFNENSLSGTDEFLIQIGDSGGFETTGYVSSSSFLTSTSSGIVSSTSGFVVEGGGGGSLLSGDMSIRNISGNIWVSSHAAKLAPTVVCHGGGSKELSGQMTQVRVTRTGVNTFDNGSVGLLKR